MHTAAPRPSAGREDLHPVPPGAGVGATIASVAALLVGLVVTGGLLVVATLTSLCGLFGEPCSESENTTIGFALLGAGVTFMGVPVLVAVARRNAAWLLAPVVEVAGAFAVLLIVEWY